MKSPWKLLLETAVGSKSKEEETFHSIQTVKCQNEKGYHVPGIHRHRFNIDLKEKYIENTTRDLVTEQKAKHLLKINSYFKRSAVACAIDKELYNEMKQGQITWKLIAKKKSNETSNTAHIIC